VSTYQRLQNVALTELIRQLVDDNNGSSMHFRAHKDYYVWSQEAIGDVLVLIANHENAKKLAADAESALLRSGNRDKKAAQRAYMKEIRGGSDRQIGQVGFLKNYCKDVRCSDGTIAGLEGAASLLFVLEKMHSFDSGWRLGCRWCCSVPLKTFKVSRGGAESHWRQTFLCRMSTIEEFLDAVRDFTALEQADKLAINMQRLQSVLNNSCSKDAKTDII